MIHYDKFEYHEGAPIHGSDVFNYYWYNADDEELLLSFSAGYKRVYFDVNLDMFNEFKDAPSKGGFYNAELKGEFTSASIEDDVTLEMIEPEPVNVVAHDAVTSLKAGEFVISKDGAAVFNGIVSSNEVTAKYTVNALLGNAYEASYEVDSNSDLNAVAVFNRAVAALNSDLPVKIVSVTRHF